MLGAAHAPFEYDSHKHPITTSTKIITLHKAFSLPMAPKGLLPQWFLV